MSRDSHTVFGKSSKSYRVDTVANRDATGAEASEQHSRGRLGNHHAAEGENIAALCPFYSTWVRTPSEDDFRKAVPKRYVRWWTCQHLGTGSYKHFRRSQFLPFPRAPCASCFPDSQCQVDPLTVPTTTSCSHTSQGLCGGAGVLHYQQRYSVCREGGEVLWAWLQGERSINNEQQPQSPIKKYLSD